MTCLFVCLSLLLPGLLNAGMHEHDDWKQYVDPGRAYVIRYPDAATPVLPAVKDSSVLTQVSFRFEQPFDNGADRGSLSFSFEVKAFSNPDHLSPTMWVAKEMAPHPQPLEVRPIRVGGQDGVTFKTTNLAWTTVTTAVGNQNRMYELSYTDVSENGLLSQSERSRWSKVLNEMRESFEFIDGRSMDGER